MIVATAVSAGVMLSRRPENISRGRVRWSGPAISSAITTSSNDAAKANSAPEPMAGMMPGSVTRRNVSRGVAPQAAAARGHIEHAPLLGGHDDQVLEEALGLDIGGEFFDEEVAVILAHIGLGQAQLAKRNHLDVVHLGCS